MIGILESQLHYHWADKSDHCAEDSCNSVDKCFRNVMAALGCSGHLVALC